MGDMPDAAMLPLATGEEPQTPNHPVWCRDCKRPVRSARARRDGLGGGCRRKHSSVRRTPGPFRIDQEPLPYGRTAS
jgi:hypothetical protein